MFKPNKVMVDTSVWLPYFLGTQPQCDEVKHLFLECGFHDVTLLYTPTICKDVYCLVAQQMRSDLGRERADESADDASDADGADASDEQLAQASWACVDAMARLAEVTPLALMECSLARKLRTTHDDLADNLMIAAAETSDVDYVVTYNEGLLKDLSRMCLTPMRLCEHLAGLSK